MYKKRVWSKDQILRVVPHWPFPLQLEVHSPMISRQGNLVTLERIMNRLSHYHSQLTCKTESEKFLHVVGKPKVWFLVSRCQKATFQLMGPCHCWASHETIIATIILTFYEKGEWKSHSRKKRKVRLGKILWSLQ